MKYAYPNYDEYINFKTPRDTEKWLKAAKNLYFYVNQGREKSEAIDKVTAGWDHMEKLEFMNWLKYYQENTHRKYAQVGYWEDINRAGYFVPVHKEDENKADVPNIPEEIEQITNKQEIIEAQRYKILSRLDSAEKLLRSNDGHLMAGKELSSLMRAIYDLKERIHVVNKKTSSNKLYQDLIIRQANILNKQGFDKAGSMLNKLADELNPPEAINPLQNTGNIGTLRGEGPGQISPQNNNPTEEISEGMKEFLEGLNTSNFTDADDLEVQDSDDELIVEAQAVPPPPPASKKPSIEVEEKIENKHTGFDNMLDQALSNLTVQDVINKLEDLAKIFKTREVPRQLAFVDMMLDQLGLASFFPSLAEAMNRSLDSNQYMSTRIEDILSKLRGAVETTPIDLKSEAPENPAVSNIKKNLQNDEKKEKDRKEMRKKVEDEALSQQMKVTPEIEVEEDLNKPSNVTQTPPAPLPPK